MKRFHFGMKVTSVVNQYIRLRIFKYKVNTIKKVSNEARINENILYL